MTRAAYIAGLTARLNSLSAAKVIYPVASEIHRRRVKRIFDNGESGDGSKIGTYSTKPAYFSKTQFVKQGSFRPQGKTSSGKFKNGKERKSMYLLGGYAELRRAQGRQAAFVDLSYSNDLRNDLASHLAVEGESVVARVSRKINADKMKWLTDKYGPTTFRHNKEERKLFNKEVGANITKQLFK